MKRVPCLLSLIFLLLGSCQAKHQVENPAPNTAVKTTQICNATETFNRKDSTGTFQGKVASFNDTSHSSASGGIDLISGNGDSFTFLFTYPEIVGLNKNKMQVGACIKIEYRADIIMEEGVEINRLFYITKISYGE